MSIMVSEHNSLQDTQHNDARFWLNKLRIIIHNVMLCMSLYWLALWWVSWHISTIAYKTLSIIMQDNDLTLVSIILTGIMMSILAHKNNNLQGNQHNTARYWLIIADYHYTECHALHVIIIIGIMMSIMAHKNNSLQDS